MNLVIEMTQIIYADILVVVNSYVTYFLLRLTGIICSSEVKPLRLVLASIFGGVYSLILLLPNITDFAIVLTRIFASIILILIGYKISNKRQFIRLITSFFAINFAFAGFMFALWYCYNPTSFLFNSGIVYFNIDTVSLLFLTIVCYLIFIIIHRLLQSKSPHNLLYEMTIFTDEKSFKCKAFLDTGNSVSEPFSQLPVIIVNSEVFLYEDTSNLQSFDCTHFLNQTLRFIPCKGIGQMNMLPAFKPDKIHIKGINLDFETSLAYIAITNNKIKNGEFEALLNSRVFENKTNEKGEDYETKTKAAIT